MHFLHPIDMLDAAAQTHDYWYDAAKTGGVYGALFVDKVGQADRQLAISTGEVVRRYLADVNDSINNQPITRAEFIWALKVIVAFMELAGFKSIAVLYVHPNSLRDKFN